MKILVVDDEDLLVKGIRFNLQSEGYTVISGSNGLEAVQLTQSEQPDLIVSDIRMAQQPLQDVCSLLHRYMNCHGGAVDARDGFSTAASKA